MSRRMSCSMTVLAVRSRIKTVTRRHVDTWRTLKAGDRLTLVEKAMGLPRGAKQVVLAEVEIVDVRVERLLAGVTPAEIAAEGFDPHGMAPSEWCAWWMRGHGLVNDDADLVECRRIEWRYLDGLPGREAVRANAATIVAGLAPFAGERVRVNVHTGEIAPIPLGHLIPVCDAAEGWLLIETWKVRSVDDLVEIYGARLDDGTA